MGNKGLDEKIVLIKKIIDENKISVGEIDTLAEIDYPLFSFKWLQNYSFVDCAEPKFFQHFLQRLQKLSALGWKGIRVSGRHQYGMEKIPRKDIKPQALPGIVTPDVEEFDVFRAVGDNRPMIGLVQGRIFHVIFIEADFGDVYCHK